MFGPSTDFGGGKIFSPLFLSFHTHTYIHSDFGDGVNNVFEENHVSDCTFDTIDSGGISVFQDNAGAAFTNRGNVLRGNTFERIRNTAGLGVQVASNQAVYLDDQMSWVVGEHLYRLSDCNVRRWWSKYLFLNNQCTRCGTVSSI